jgi:hypothetical protein
MKGRYLGDLLNIKRVPIATKATVLTTPPKRPHFTILSNTHRMPQLHLAFKVDNESCVLENENEVVKLNSSNYYPPMLKLESYTKVKI